MHPGTLRIARSKVFLSRKADKARARGLHFQSHALGKLRLHSNRRISLISFSLEEES